VRGLRSGKAVAPCLGATPSWLVVSGRRAAGLVKLAIRHSELASRGGAVLLRLPGRARELRVLTAGLAKLALEVLDPASQELPPFGNAGQLALGSLQRAACRGRAVRGRLHGCRGVLGRCCCRLRLCPGAGRCRAGR
jgi:hypothetical protein